MVGVWGVHLRLSANSNLAKVLLLRQEGLNLSQVVIEHLFAQNVAYECQDHAGWDAENQHCVMAPRLFALIPNRSQYPFRRKQSLVVSRFAYGWRRVEDETARSSREDGEQRGASSGRTDKQKRPSYL